MRYETTETLNDAEFKRATGVQRSTFEKMKVVVEQSQAQGGRPTKLNSANRLMLTLMYWREYRTEFHIGLTYGVSESTVCRTIQKIENALIKSQQFHLPGKKALHSGETRLEIVVIDATEQPVERPKKTTKALQRQKEATHPKSTNRC
jgi:hypothetical protein